MNTVKAKQVLSHAATLLRRMREKVDRLDGNLVEQDIAARRQEALIGYEFAKQVDRIEAALQSVKSNLDLDQWCKQTCECDISTMRRRKRLFRHWKEYEGKRRELGQCGQTGLLFALSLVKEDRSDQATDRQALPVRSGSGTKLGPLTERERCKFITGNALTELSKMPDQTANVIVTSPPYWPAKRMYGGKGSGFEATLGEYITSLVTLFREARRVLKDTGVVWIVIDDSYAKAGGKWTAEGYLLKRPGRQKSAKSTGMGYQDTKCLRPDANLLFIPARLAMALQDDGWMCRAEIIWHKGPGGGRPESVRNRVTKTHEKVFMFTKQRQVLLRSRSNPRTFGSAIHAIHHAGKTKAGIDAERCEQGLQSISQPDGSQRRQRLDHYTVELPWKSPCNDAAGIGAPMLAGIMSRRRNSVGLLRRSRDDSIGRTATRSYSYQH